MTTTKIEKYPYEKYLDDFHFYSAGTRIGSDIQIEQKYQILWYRKRLIAKALHKMQVDPKRVPSDILIRLSKAFDKYVLTGRLIYAIKPDWVVSDNNGYFEVLDNACFQIFNGENMELILPNEKRFIDVNPDKRQMTYFIQPLYARNNYSTMRAIEKFFLLPLEMDESNNAIYGKKLCFTGKSYIRRETLEFLTTTFGGTFQTSVTKHTNYLIIPKDRQKLIQKPTTKLKKIIEQNKNAKSEDEKVKIIEEQEFIQLLPPLDDQIDLTQYIVNSTPNLISFHV